MNRIKRTIAALALALFLGAGTAHAQNVITGAWWYCIHYVHVPFYGDVVIAEDYRYTDGLNDPSFGYSIAWVDCYIIMVCYGEYGCQ